METTFMGYIGTIISNILGLYSYTGIMEKKMETTIGFRVQASLEFRVGMKGWKTWKPL